MYGSEFDLYGNGVYMIKTIRTQTIYFGGWALIVGVVRMYHFDRTILTILRIANIQRSSKNDNGRRDPDGGNVNCFSSYGAQVRKLRRASQAGLNQHAVGEYVPIQEREAWYTTMCILRDPDTFLDQTSRLATSSILGAMYDWDMSTPWYEPMSDSLSKARKTK
ncbi:hypothetical protein D9613_010328 [Agrocybe pediades]|uniref:Uncharacterized protein n=1 Tax=Agrocybe pediades TaxID=84607 RepID=A0A8H4QFJ5_9AGAR|nr:hypothetical protein D9613_010328 [Agrocybe pediades]